MSLELTIVTPEGLAFAGAVETAVLPGAEGEFGVLEQHARTLGSLKLGIAEIREAGGSRWAVLSDGFADVGAQQIVVMVDRCELAEEIDAAAAEAERTALQSQLDALPGGEKTAYQRSELELGIEHARLRAELGTRR